MRIIGGKDFYDVGVGQDNQVIFVRKKDARLDRKRAQAAGISPPAPYLEACRAKHADSGGRWQAVGSSAMSWQRHIFSDGLMHAFRPVSVVLCGRRWNGVRMLTSGPAPSNGTVSPAGTGVRDDRRTFWSWDALLAGASAQGIAVRWNRRDEDYRVYRARKRSGAHAGDASRYFGPHGMPSDAREFLVSEGITLLTFGIGPWQDNDPDAGWRVDGDNLKEMEFFRALDPYQTWQEIAMWVGGVLARPGMPMVEITDPDVLAAKHGFDKWSFRRPPESPRTGRSQRPGPPFRQLIAAKGVS